MTTTFKPYPKYKPSGVEWLGDIPEHWELKKLKHVSTINDEVISEATPLDTIIEYVDIGSVDASLGITAKESFRFADAPSRARRIARAGDVAVSTVRTYLKAIVRVDEEDASAVYSTGFAIVRARDISSGYLSFALREYSFLETVLVRSKGIGYPSIGTPELSCISLCKPSKAEQIAISNFLDSETAKIDETIKELEASIELLNEEKTSLINEYVTGKINPETGKPYPKYKPSGVEWLGDIPDHWEVMRSKRVLSERNERSETGLEEMLSVSHLTGVTRRSEKDVNMFEAETNEGCKLCSKDNLAVNTLWAWMGAMGVAKDDGIVSPAYHVYWIAKSMSPRYVDAVVRFPNFVSEITRYSKGVWSSRLRLYPEGLFEAWLPIPPFEEQELIMEVLSTRGNEVDSLITEKQSLIETLKEYRTSLIHGAVTGKIDLRNA